jgi:hypothetical protein
MFRFTPASQFAHPFTYTFLPTDGSFTSLSGTPHLCEADNTTAIERDMYDVATYKELMFGPYYPENGVAMTREKEEFMQRMLDNARE